MLKSGQKSSLILSLAIALLMGLTVLTVAAQDKTPVIIIPGLTGSELVNSKTNEVVWFKAPRSKDDDLRLPVSANISRNRDSLVPGDVLRSIKVGIFPRLDVYGGLIEAFKTKAGYHEENWESPTADADKSSIFVYPYDWRLDNVENARLLIKKIEKLKLRLKQPDLKFNIIAHSMGGIIARYAAMYGDADLPPGGRKPKPTWAGAKHFEKIVLLGTPNEGSALALSALVDGFDIGGININLPWVQNLDKFDVFTIPSAYQLLPAPGTLRVLDENFEPIDIDLYNPKTWSKYGWNPIDDKRFPSQFKLAERRTATAFFAAMLDRAKRLHEALAAGNGAPKVSYNIVGAECNNALDALVMYRDKKSGSLKTMFKPSGFTKASGDKVTTEELKELMLTGGDGVVTRRSLESNTQSRFAGVPSILVPATSQFICEEHNKLAANDAIQDYLMGLFGNVPVPVKAGK